MRTTSIVLGFLALVLFACGGGGGTGSETKAAGSLYVQYVNQRLRVWVTVVSVDGQIPQEKDLPQGVSPGQEVQLDLDEITPVTADLPGGTEVSLNLRVSRERQKDFDLNIDFADSRKY